MALGKRAEQKPTKGTKRSEEHTSEPSHSQISYAVFCLKKKKKTPLLTKLHNVHLIAHRAGNTDTIRLRILHALSLVLIAYPPIIITHNAPCRTSTPHVTEED